MRNKFLLTCATLVLTLLWGGVSINELRAQEWTDVTATYVTNPSFESDAVEVKTTTQNSNFTGWTVASSSSGYNNQEILASGSAGSSDFGAATSSDGSYHFFTRVGWNNTATNTVTITTTTTSTLPVGLYKITADWKGAESRDNTSGANSGSGSYLELKALAESTTLANATTGTYSLESNGGSTYFATAAWQQIEIAFTVLASSTIDIQFISYMKGGKRADVLLDNVKVMYAPLPLDEFKNALQEEIDNANAKKSLGSDNAEALATLNAAIATAEQVYHNATTEAELTNAISTLRAAVNVYIEATALWADGTEYYLYNVEADQFLTAGSSWGTKAAVGGSAKMGFTRSAGTQNVYTLSTNSLYSGKYLGSNAYMDNGTAAEWTFEKVDGQPNVYMLKNGDNYLKKDDSGKGVSVSKGAPADNKGYWKVYTKETLTAYALANADTENPINMTAYIVNPDFPRKSSGYGITTGWANISNVKGAEDGNNSNYCAEHWHKTSWFSQTLAGLPAGKYTVRVQGFSTQGTDEAFVFAGNDQTKLKYNGTAPGNQAAAANTFREDGWWNEVTTTLHTGDLPIGVRTSSSGIWILMDNFSISFLGADTSDLLAEITAAEALYGDGSEIGASALLDAINAAKAVSVTSHVTQEAVDAELTALQTAENVYTSSQATLDAPVDFTAAIGDADFSTNTGKWSAYSVQYGVNENYNKAFDIKQTITLPAAGVYALGVQAFYRNAWSENAYNAHFNGTEDKAQLYAGENTVNVKSVMADALVSDDIATGSRSNVNGFYFPNDRNCANAYFEAGKYQNYLVFTADAAGEITIGIKSASTTAGNWSSFDNFTLKYYGQAATEAQVTAKVLAGTQRQSISEAKREAATATAYNAAVSTWEAVDASTMTAADIRSANEDVTEKALLAEVSAIAYTSLNTAIAEAEAYAAATDYAGKEAYNTAISTAETAYNNGTYTAAEVTTAIETLATAKVNYICSQDKSFDTPADYTGLLANPSFEKGNMTGWTFIASIGGDNGVKENSNATYTMSNVDGSYLFNTYNSDGNEIRYGIYQNITAPQTGWYSLSAVVGSDPDKTIILTLGATTKDVASSAEGKGVGVTGTTDKVYFTEGAEMLIKVNSTTWFKADNFQLAYYGDGVKVDMVITDAQWATFVAPFEVAVPSGVTASTIDSETGGILKLTSVGAAIPANTPVVLNSDAVVNETFYGVAEAGTPKVGLLTGVYTNTTAETGWYVLQNNDGKVGFYLVDTGVATPTVGANRAYLTVPKGASAPRFFLFDDATGINTIAQQAEKALGIIYDMQGRRVNNVTSHGIYIINGKKIVK